MIRAKKNSWKEIPDENKIPTLKKKFSWRIVVKKKILTPFYVRKKFYHQRFGKENLPKPNQKSNGRRQSLQ